MPEAVIMTPTEAAQVLFVSTDTVRKWADEGKLPCMKTMSGRRVFKSSDVENLRRKRLAE